MSYGNRLLVTAVAGLVICIALFAGAYFGSLYSPDHKQYQAVSGETGSSDSYQGVTRSLPDLAGIPRPVERAIANPQPDSGQDHEKRDLAAQESMAVWAFYMTLFSGLTVVVTSIGTIYIAKQVKLTQEAVDDTSEATAEMAETNRLMRADQRAWLEIDVEVYRVSFSAKQISFHYRATATNIGRTVATGVYVECAAFPFGPSNPTEIADYAKSSFGIATLLNYRDLLPNGRIIVNSVAHFSPNKLRNIKDGGNRIIFTGVIVARVNYHASEDAPAAQTSRSFNVIHNKTGAFRYNPQSFYAEESHIEVSPGGWSRAT